MKDRFWIAFGDIHEQIGALESIPDLEQASAVLLSGDLTNVGSQEEVLRILETIEARNPRILAQIGNMDTQPVDRLLSERKVNAHARVTDLDHGVALAAVGYSTPTPFATPSEADETQICQWAYDVLQASSSFEKVIFMIHTPPLGTVVDRLLSGTHVGSLGLRGLIEKFQPDIVITGHIHEGRGEEWIGRSHVLNPGEFSTGVHVRIDDGPEGLKACLRSPM